MPNPGSAARRGKTTRAPIALFEAEFTDGDDVLVMEPRWIAARLAARCVATLARGRSALTLHLLAPNQRAVQITNDLAGFWERHYPALRRQPMRRYPKHDGPEDDS